MFLALESKLPILVMAAFIVLGLIFTLMFGPQPGLRAAQFLAEVRYTGISLGVSIASAAAGWLAPVVATTLVTVWGSSISIGRYMAVMAVVSLISVSQMKGTNS